MYVYGFTYMNNFGNQFVTVGTQVTC